MIGEFKPKLKQAVSRVESVAGSVRPANGRSDPDQQEDERRPSISPSEQLRQFRRLAEQIVARRR
jgi:hypothetical protein